jgi:hypothetical protein
MTKFGEVAVGVNVGVVDVGHDVKVGGEVIVNVGVNVGTRVGANVETTAGANVIVCVATTSTEELHAESMTRQSRLK